MLTNTGYDFAIEKIDENKPNFPEGLTSEQMLIYATAYNHAIADVKNIITELKEANSQR